MEIVEVERRNSDRFIPDVSTTTSSLKLHSSSDSAKAAT
jgi:hypothetical protein